MLQAIAPQRVLSISASLSLIIPLSYFKNGIWLCYPGWTWTYEQLRWVCVDFRSKMLLVFWWYGMLEP